MEEEMIKKDEFVNNKGNNRMIITILVVIIVLLIGIVGYLLIFKEKDKDETVKPTSTPTIKPISETSTFEYNDDNFGLSSSGYAIVKGYGVVEDNTVGFYVVSTDSNDFKKAFEKWGYDDNIVPLGCLNNNVISFTTAADEFGPSNYTGSDEDAHLYFTKDISLSSDISNKIMSSNIDNQISLKLGKSKLTRYINLYDECRTVITSVELVD